MHAMNYSRALQATHQNRLIIIAALYSNTYVKFHLVIMNWVPFLTTINVRSYS